MIEPLAEPLIAFVAPSSVVPRYEFELGLHRLREAGLKFRVHPQCRKRHLFFAGTDEDRARAFVEAALDPEVSVVWCARGGYGAYRLLPILDRMFASEHRRPGRKLFVGYSDATCLFDYVRGKWGWDVLHAPMPGLRTFLDIRKSEWRNLLAWIHGQMPDSPFGPKKLKFLGSAPDSAVEGEVTGGSLSLWTALQGTPYMPGARDKLLFLEDVGETLSRLDRMIHQLMMTGGLDGVKAILLGDFKECRDPVTQVLQGPVKRGKAKLVPSRPSISQSRYFREIFGSISECYRIPVAAGLPVGHGPGKQSLPIGARCRLNPDGRLEVLAWSGLR